MVKPILIRKNKTGDETYLLRVANGRLKSGKTRYEKRSYTVSKDLSETQKKKLLEKETFMFEEEINKGRNTTGIVYFKAYSNIWLYAKKQSNLAPMTICDYERTVNRLNDEFGQYRVDEITGIMVMKLLEKLRTKGSNKNNKNKGLSEKTLKNIYDVLYNIYECAIDDEKVNKNPLKSKNFPKPKPTKKDIVFLDEEDVVKLATALIEDKVDLKYQCMASIALGTGARIGEIQALEWKDIDFKTGKVSITKTIQRITTMGIVEKAPKTKNSVREVYIGEDVLDMLKEHKVEQEETKKKLGDLWLNTIELTDAKGKPFTKQNDKIFTQWNGKPIYNGTFGYWLKKFTDKHNLKPYTPHSFRHTFATLSLEENQPINAISRTLGHSNISTTSNIYIKTTNKSKEVLSTVMTNKMSMIFNLKR